MKKKIFITGHKGFVGKWLSKFLSKKLFEIIKTNDKDRIDLSRINSVMSIQGRCNYSLSKQKFYS